MTWLHHDVIICSEWRHYDVIIDDLPVLLLSNMCKISEAEHFSLTKMPFLYQVFSFLLVEFITRERYLVDKNSVAPHLPE